MFRVEGTMREIMALPVHRVNANKAEGLRDGAVRGGISWWGLSSIKAVEEACDKGWAQGWETAQKELSLENIPKLRTVRRHKARGDFGDFLDIQRVYAGDLDKAWERTERDYWPMVRSHSYVTLCCDISGNASVSVDSMKWRGYATILLADMLQVSGRNVQVVAYDGGVQAFENGEASLIVLRLKEFEDSLIPDQLGFVLGLPAFFRYYSLKALCSHSARCSHGFGRHDDRPPPEYVNDQTIIIKDIWNKDSAQTFLNEEAEKLNGEAQVA